MRPRLYYCSFDTTCSAARPWIYGDTQKWDSWFTWPQDVIGYEQRVSPPPRHVAWRSVNGKRYYLPAEVYDVIGSEWFFHEKDKLKSEGELLKLYSESRERGANLLLDVPPDKHGLIPREYSEALMRLEAKRRPLSRP